MENLEKVEKLKEKANITYEEAKAILEECDWDLLDAVVKLEAQGKMKEDAAASYSTKGSAEETGAPTNPQEVAESYQSYQQEQQKKDRGFFRTLWNLCKYLFHKSWENHFIVRRYNEQIIEIPVILLICIMLCCFWFLLILMGISLFFGFSYRFAGPDLGRDDVNAAMAKATQAAEGFKNEMNDKINETIEKDQ